MGRCQPSGCSSLPSFDYFTLGLSVASFLQSASGQSQTPQFPSDIPTAGGLHGLMQNRVAAEAAISLLSERAVFF